MTGILENESPTVYSGRGRVLSQGGGIAPDQAAETWKLDRWMAFLDQSTGFINFAQSYLERHGKIREGFAAKEEVLEEFGRFSREAGVCSIKNWRRNNPGAQFENQ